MHNIHDNTINLKISKMVNVYAFVTMYPPYSSVFMTYETPSGTEKYHKRTEPEGSKMAKNM